MNKKFLIPLFIIGAIGLIVAGAYIVNSFSVQVDVAEPFGVSYAILGDAGVPAWKQTTCGDIPLESFVDLSQEEQPVDFSYIYAGENRELCVKIINSAEVPLGYIVSGEVRAGLGNFEDCSIAFSDLTPLEADVDGGQTLIANKPIHISAESPVVEDCVLDISVARTEASA